jgi:superfamily II DNA or RNA helicase
VAGSGYTYPVQPEAYGFQVRAADKICKFLAQGADTCLVSPTGSGKTVIAGTALQRMVQHLARAQAKPLRAISISHSNPLCDQLEERLCPSFTVQGLLEGHLPDYQPDLVIWDECHHSEGDLWNTVRGLFKKAVLLGLTPTPQRSDGRALGLFQELVVAAHYSELIDEGIIVPCKVSGPQAVHTDKKPDPVQAYLDAGEGKKGLFFLPNIAAAEDAAKQLQRRKVSAAAYHSHLGKTVRKDMFRAFATGELHVIVTCFALSEGIDVPDAHVGVLAQQCTGLSQYLNTAGRILRSAPGKRFAHLIDLTGARLRHGNPTIDRDYSLHGAGIYRKNDDIDYGGREYSGREELPQYKAKIVVWDDYKWPTQDDKRRQLSWLKRQAAQGGYTEEHAAQAFKMLFGSKGNAEAAQ